METRLSIDWISATVLDNDTSMIFACPECFHNHQHWENGNPMYGYTHGAKHVTGVRAFQHSNREDMGKHIVYSGKTIERILTMYSIEALEILRHHIEQRNHIARLDLALDFINYKLTVDDFQYEFQSGQALTKLRKVTTVQNLDGDGHTLYIGSRKKRKKLVRIYDKAAEQHIQGDWIRVEVQLMGVAGTETARLIVEADDPKQVMLSAIKSVIHFPKLASWGMAFNGVQDVTIASEPQTSGMRNHWIKTQVIPAIASEIIIDSSFWVQFNTLLHESLLSKGLPVKDFPF